MVKVIPPDHVDDVPIVDPNYYDDVPVVPEPVLVDEDEDPEEKEFEEEEEPQEEEYDMEVNVENTIEHKDETVPASVHEVGESSTAPFLREDIDEQGTAAMEKLVEKLGNVEDKAECKKLKNELEEARKVSMLLALLIELDMRMLEMMLEGLDQLEVMMSHMLFKKTESVFRISESAEGKKTMNQMPWTEMKQLMTAELCLIEEVQRIEHKLLNLKVKEYNIVAYTKRFNELGLMCPRMVEPERVKVDAYIWGLTDNIKGEVTSSKPANLNEAVRMAHKL
nr:hypothetical protein [Tanacetum cinerariifolium]